MRGDGEAAKAARLAGGKPPAARRPRVRLVTSHSGGQGAPPGTTTSPREELADGDRLRTRKDKNLVACLGLDRKRGP